MHPVLSTAIALLISLPVAALAPGIPNPASEDLSNTIGNPVVDEPTTSSGTVPGDMEKAYGNPGIETGLAAKTIGSGAIGGSGQGATTARFDVSSVLATMAPDREIIGADTIRSKERRAAVMRGFLVALDDPDEQVRVRALWGLSELAEPETLDRLLEIAATDPSVDARRAALAGVLEIDPGAGLPLVRARLESETDPRFRSQMLYMIAESGDDSVAELIVEALDDPDANVRAAALHAAASLKTHSALAGVIRAVDDTDDDVRRQAMYAIAELVGTEPAPPEAVAALRSAAGDEDPRIRAEAIRALAEIDGQHNLSILEGAAADSDADVRRQAIMALAEKGGDKHVGILVAALKDRDEHVQETAAWALAEVGTGEAVQGLASVSNDPNPRIRASALRALSRSGDPSSAGILLSAIDDPDRDVRSAAVHGLAEVRSDEAVSALVKVLASSDQEIRRVAVWALTEHADDPAAIRGIMGVVEDPDPDVRRAAVHGLADSRTPEAVPILIRRLKHDADPEIRKMAAFALGEFGSLQAIEALNGALEDEDVEVRRAAASALSGIDVSDSGMGQRSELGAPTRMAVESLGAALVTAVSFGIQMAGDELSTLDLDQISRSIETAVTSAVSTEEVIRGIGEVLSDVDVEAADAATEAIIDMLEQIAREAEDSDAGRSAIQELQRMSDERAREALGRLGHRR